MRTLLCAVVSAFFLAGCGGGGGNPIAPSTPTAKPPTPTPAPTVSAIAYTAHIVWSGAGASAKDRGMLMSRKVRFDDSSSATPGPIVLAEPDCSDPNCSDKFGGGPNQFAALAALQIEPQPTTTSVPNYSDSGQSIAITSETPAPNASATAYALVEAITPGVSNSSTLTAFTSNPSVSASQTVYIYPRLTLQCNVDGTGAGGVTISGGSLTVASGPSTADLYISGPNCPAPYTSTEAGQTIHFPNGGTTFGTLTQSQIIALPDVTAANYSNTQTSLSFEQIESFEPEGIIFATASGDLVKFEPYVLSPGDANDDSYIAGPYAQQSFSVDSF